MSGNGDSDYDSPPSGGDTSSINCATLSGRGTIMSPSAAVLATLNVGDILAIRLRASTGPVQAFTASGQLVGTVFLTSALSASLIYCLNELVDYQGEVTSLAGGSCELVISAV